MLANSSAAKEMLWDRCYAEDRCCEEVAEELGTQLVMCLLQQSIDDDQVSLRLLFPPA